MEGGAYLGELASGIIYLLAGTRLVLLGVRTGETPERLLGASFLSFGVIGRPLQHCALGVLDGLLDAAQLRRARRLPPSGDFDRTVHARSLSAPEPAVEMDGLRDIGPARRRRGRFRDGGRLGGFFARQSVFWFEWVGYTLPFAWAGLEAFAQYRTSLRRQRLGLCDRFACNRYLLWGCFGMVQVTVSFVLLEMYADFESNNAFSAFFDGLMGALEIVTIALVWLVFFPPRFYRKLIPGTDDAESRVEES